MIDLALLVQIGSGLGGDKVVEPLPVLQVPRAQLVDVSARFEEHHPGPDFSVADMGVFDAVGVERHEDLAVGELEILEDRVELDLGSWRLRIFVRFVIVFAVALDGHGPNADGAIGAHCFERTSVP
jgi:hypothetical protein